MPKSTLLRGASLAAITFALGLGAGAVKADESTGWYVGALGGVNHAQSTYAEYDGLSDVLDYKKGYGAGVLGGYDFGPFSLQADVIYRRNSAKAEQYDGIEYSQFGGSTTTISSMFSALYDINTGTAFTPYIGAGVGIAQVKFTRESVSDRKLSFAYQGVAGVNYDVAQNVVLGLEYRYFATPGVDGIDVGYDNPYDEFETRNHSLFFGVTYKFGEAAPAPVPVVAAPPPPAPPAPELARSYLVFFDWNSSSVTTEAATIIGEAAKAAKQLAVTRVELTGHADRSGTPAYNQKLSENRGAAVKNALVQLGIPADEITVVGKGEASPLVPTADGVREPQNRRVEIVLP
jgi:OOP family OmpA-OmpF porin